MASKVKQYMINKAKKIIFKKRKGVVRDYVSYWDKNKMTNRLEIEVNRLHSIYINKLMSIDDLMHDLRKLIVVNYPITNIDKDIISSISTRCNKETSVKLHGFLLKLLTQETKLELSTIKTIFQVLEIIKGIKYE